MFILASNLLLSSWDAFLCDNPAICFYVNRYISSKIYSSSCNVRYWLKTENVSDTSYWLHPLVKCVLSRIAFFIKAKGESVGWAMLPIICISLVALIFDLHYYCFLRSAHNSFTLFSWITWGEKITQTHKRRGQWTPCLGLRKDHVTSQQAGTWNVTGPQQWWHNEGRGTTCRWL